MATFFNQATLSYSGGTVNSNVTVGEIVAVLSVTKTAVINEYSQGDEITYAVNIINSGSTAFTGLTLSDNLGEYTFSDTTLVPLEYIADSIKYFTNGILQATPTVTSTSPLTVTGLFVPANGVATVLYTVRANGFANPTESGTVENTVTVSGPNIASVTDTETITASVGPELSILKSLSPTTVNENGQLTYTFTIENLGNTDAVATDDIVLTDTFDPILRNITVIYNGTVWTEGVEYTYDETTGAFSTVSSAITVPAATYIQDPVTGVWSIETGTATLVVTGTV